MSRFLELEAPKERVMKLGPLLAYNVAGSAQVVPFVRRPDIGEPSDGEPGDAELVREAATGRRAAQHVLYVRHCGKVRARVTYLLGRSSDVDDVLQDTFVAAYRDIQQLTNPERFASWVCGIAVHQVHRRLRRRKLLRKLGLDGDHDAGLHQVVDPAASPEVRAQLRTVEHGLRDMTVPQRIAWTLRHVEGCSLDETAEQCGVSLATAKRHIHRAEEQLRLLFAVEGEGA